MRLARQQGGFGYGTGHIFVIRKLLETSWRVIDGILVVDWDYCLYLGIMLSVLGPEVYQVPFWSL